MKNLSKRYTAIGDISWVLYALHTNKLGYLHEYYHLVPLAPWKTRSPFNQPERITVLSSPQAQRAVHAFARGVDGPHARHQQGVPKGQRCCFC